jgi:glutathione peroxidase
MSQLSGMTDPKLYDFTINRLDDSPFDMQDLHGKVVLIVNTASQCGFTPQYKDLERLYRQYQSRGFVVLGVPCNQFGAQEPGTPAEIQVGCTMNYDVTFPLLEKIDVNGSKAHPLFIWLRQECPGIFGTTIKWNFTKFLIDRQGRPINRFAPLTNPASLTDKIEELLS